MHRTLVLFSLLLTLSCSREEIEFHSTELLYTQERTLVNICHIDGQGEYSLITINESAIQAHLDHGDFLPSSCMGDGLLLNELCEIIDVSMEEDEENEMDDDCDGVVDEGDGGGNVVCPCFTIDDILAAPNLAYYDYRIQDCAGPTVGFSQNGSCNYGASIQLMVVVAPDCGACFDLTLEEITECQQIIEMAQMSLNLGNYCTSLTTDEEDKPFLVVNPNG